MEDMWELIRDDLNETIRTNLRKSISNWTLIYGPDNLKLKEKCLEFSNDIKECSSQLYTESENNKVQLIEETEIKFKEFYSLCKDLDMNTQALGFADHDPVYNICEWLKKKVNEQKQMVAERVILCEDLLKQQHELCKILKETPLQLASGTPSVSFLSQLTQHIESLKMKKVEFDEQMEAKRKTVIEILKRLELQPVHPVELFCISPFSESLPYNVDTLKEIEGHLQKLIAQESNMRNEADTLRETLSTLWARIGESIETRDRVLEKCKGFTKKDITKLKEELHRCEKIKQKNLKFYIENVKQELADWWSRCLLSEQEKDRFTLYKETHYSDDLLSLIELELERVKSFYQRYADIYDALERREKAWERLLHLEAASKDSRRLLSRDGNRGGALLREEQERKKVQKVLPKIEDYLNKKLTEFEREEHREFTIYGESVREIIKRQYNDFHTKKDHAKKTASASTNAQPAAKKRKVPDSQQSQVGTKYRTPLNKADRNIATSSNASSRRDLRTGFTSISNASTSSSYSLFQEHLERKSETLKTPCRSTLTPSNVLKPHNSQVPSHSSPKTPRLTPYHRPRPNTITRSKTPQSRPPFKVGGSSTKIPTLTLPIKSPKVTPQLRTPRKKLPIII